MNLSPFYAFSSLFLFVSKKEVIIGESNDEDDNEVFAGKADGRE